MGSRRSSQGDLQRGGDAGSCHLPGQVGRWGLLQGMTKGKLHLPRGSRSRALNSGDREGTAKPLQRSTVEDLAKLSSTFLQCSSPAHHLSPNPAPSTSLFVGGRGCLHQWSLSLSSSVGGKRWPKSGLKRQDTDGPVSS